MLTFDEREVIEEDLVDGAITFRLVREDEAMTLEIPLFDVQDKLGLTHAIEMATAEWNKMAFKNDNGVVTVVHLKDHPFTVGVVATFYGLGDIVKEQTCNKN